MDENLMHVYVRAFLEFDGHASEVSGNAEAAATGNNDNERDEKVMIAEKKVLEKHADALIVQPKQKNAKERGDKEKRGHEKHSKKVRK
jgi:hypothetical protein